MTSSEQQLTPAEIRLAQYGQRTSTWSTASYTGGTEKALHEIALGLKAEVDRLRQQITTLTTLAERWEQMAEHGDVAIGTFDGPAAATLDAEVGERGRTYRKAATDLRDVLRTGRVPHDLMTDAELSAPATAASVAPAPAGADEHGLQTQPAEAVRG
ncbi:hypothetical protein ABZ595_28840 [Streptomyces rubradiris]|uniref:hypothetical protein n=1 Tax=Streptomyces rubradiris TaxID=285531 RepID=UPI003400C22D